MYHQLGGRGLFGLISDGHILLYFQSFDINKEDNYDEQTSVCGSRLKRVWLPSGRSCWSSTRCSSLTDGDLGVRRCVYRREETLSRDGTFIKVRLPRQKQLPESLSVLLLSWNFSQPRFQKTNWNREYTKTTKLPTKTRRLIGISGKRQEVDPTRNDIQQ